MPFYVVTMDSELKNSFANTKPMEFKIVYQDTGRTVPAPERKFTINYYTTLRWILLFAFISTACPGQKVPTCLKHTGKTSIGIDLYPAYQKKIFIL